MIEFAGVTKQYPDGTVAVDNLDLVVPDGTLTVFVGPSGCGKTTSMRMINRMIEPTSGTLTVDGSDISTVDPVKLRLGIGYVIQSAGLMPHQRVIDNVATVPVLKGESRRKARKAALGVLERVGLDPELAQRYPAQLSGGQQQRVGVARALAADPPVLLMDEPFGAVDPITRQRLQDELLRLQEDLRKTIVFVTHDFDEAVKLGDRIAILQAGSKIVQYDTPEQILTHPADDFVRTFVGAGAALKQLTLTRIRDVGLHEAAVAHIGDDPAEAVRTAQAIEREHVIVLDAQDRPQRWMSLQDLADPRSLEEVSRDEDLECVSLASTLNDALDEMLTSSHGVVVVTGRRNTYQGVVRVETIMDAMAGVRSAADTAGRAP